MTNVSPSPVSTTVGPSRAPTVVLTRRRLFWRFVRTQPMAAAALVIIVVFVILAALAPWVAPFGATEQNRTAFQQPPGGAFLFGTDDLGRDLFSRVLYGARASLAVALLSVAVSTTVGAAIPS